MAEVLATLKLKKSGVAAEVPGAPLLETGELAINYADGRLFYKDDVGAIQDLAVAFENFTETLNTAAPNATVPAISLAVTNAATNVDFVLSPKGSGAILADIPDNAATGGNKRGAYSVDLQRERTAGSQVASGASSVIAGGGKNTVSGDYSVIAGGYENEVLVGDYSGVLSGRANINQGSYSVVCSGVNNDIDSGVTYSMILGGAANTITGGDYNTIVCGETNIVSGSYSTVLNGKNNTASGDYSVVCGTYGKDYGRTGAFIHASGNSSDLFQNGKYICTETSAGSPIILGLADLAYASGDSAKIILPNNSSYLFSIKTIAYLAGEVKTWSDTALIKRGANAASTTIVWQQNEFTQGSAGTTLWDLVVDVDTTAGSIEITVDTDVDSGVSIISSIETVEVEI